MTMASRATCPSDYDKVAEFLEEPTELNELNEVVKSDGNWTVMFKRYASLETGTGREVWKASQAHSQVNAVIKTPWDSRTRDLTADNRVRIKGKTYEILTVDNKDGNDVEIIMGCRREDT